mmetsp:Transcript_4934/g.22083  ORF Transcript_4934/g.22083 Transcript_4934/m.22083 type:complete len:216 (+) Transcript_4934:208-855(+)
MTSAPPHHPDRSSRAITPRRRADHAVASAGAPSRRGSRRRRSASQPSRTPSHPSPPRRRSPRRRRTGRRASTRTSCSSHPRRKRLSTTHLPRYPTRSRPSTACSPSSCETSGASRTRGSSSRGTSSCLRAGADCGTSCERWDGRRRRRTTTGRRIKPRSRRRGTLAFSTGSGFRRELCWACGAGCMLGTWARSSSRFRRTSAPRWTSVRTPWGSR